MARIDPTAPYEITYGHGLVRLLQDGKVFLPNGKEPDGEDTEPPDPSFDPFSSHSITHVADGQSIDELDWRVLQQLVESYGGKWTDKESAIKFLHGEDA